jgi:hypothetical protein
MVFVVESNPNIGRNRIDIGGNVIVTEKGPEELNKLSIRVRIAGDI